jgi:hypothetical protein
MAVTLLFFVNAGILFYIALIVSFDLQFCKINGIEFCRNKKIFSKNEQTPENLFLFYSPYKKVKNEKLVLTSAKQK